MVVVNDHVAVAGQGVRSEGRFACGHGDQQCVGGNADLAMSAATNDVGK